MNTRWTLICLGTISPLLFLGPLRESAAGADFERDVASVLVNRCLGCHQPGKRSGGLILNTLANLLAGGDQGPAVVPGNPGQSLVMQRIVAGEMPPPETRDHPPLTANETRLLEEWIAAGAAWPQDRELGIHEKSLDLESARTFWSFQPVRRPPVPVVRNSPGVQTALDAFIWHRLEAAGLALAQRAGLATLLRRVSLDVRGIPPTLAEQEQLLIDHSPDAYERMIDRLLADPAHGERWSRHWLDLVRYADSSGYERDGPKPSVWKYRDYVIAALNSDKPYDRFVLEQVAGDELPGASDETLIASGFHALGTWNDEVDPLEAAQYRADELDDMVRTTSQAFLGLTLGCARCHNHKFDPLTMVDYYRLVAILAPLKRPNKGRLDRDVPLGTPAQIAALNARNDELARLDKRLLQLNVTEKPPDANEQIAEIRRQERALRASTPDLPGAYRCFEDSAEAPATFLLLSGRASSPGPRMQPGVPAVLALTQPLFPPPARGSTLRRLTLARWIANPDNPLTARVIVNRVWQHYFGDGLVRTPSDFGHMGARPTHPELLDWLADWFVLDAEWSLKKLHRAILSSETYRQSSAWNEDAGNTDPENKLLWRYPFRRLDVEAIRDSMLAVTGDLNRQMYGPAVYLPIPAAAIEAHTDKQAAWKKSPDSQVARRTVYAFVKRTLLVPMLETLDFCDTTQSSDRRTITSVAPQSLTLFNGEFVNGQAEKFAQRLVREAGPDVDGQLALAFQISLSRAPTSSEAITMKQFLADETAATNGHAALVQLCRVILNLNEFVYPN